MRKIYANYCLFFQVPPQSQSFFEFFVIIQDQGPIHKSKLTSSQYSKWQKQGLYIFLLPSYSPELNLIENEWERLKEDELAGQMFEDELRSRVEDYMNWL